jgi:hypothetical protein
MDKWAGKHNSGLNAAENCEEEEWGEVAVITVSDAVVDPGTVVVHLGDAAVALAAVVGARRLVATAHNALLQPLGVLFLVLQSQNF